MECRGYPGILGAILTLVGLHLPFVHILFIRISYKEALAETGPYDPTWAIVGTLLVVFLYMIAYHGIAWVFSIVLTIIFLIQTLSGSSITELLNMAQSGFWVMCAGLLLMFISPFWGSVNDSIYRRLHDKN